MTSVQITKSNQWTPEAIRVFWDYFSQRTDLHHEYFSSQVGEGMVNFLRQAGQLRNDSHVLDYGCGPGFLTQKLLAQNVKCYATDYSAEAIRLVNKKFQAEKNWQGALAMTAPPVPFPDGFFDLITCIETLEHLADESLPLIIRDTYRLLKPGGVVFFTTPNDEDLPKSYTYCPFCQAEFHKVQHLRSFTAATLRALLEAYGFKVVFCQALNLKAFQRSWPGWKDWSPRVLYQWLQSKARILLDFAQPKPFPGGREFRARAAHGPHLCVLAERSKAPAKQFVSEESNR